MSAGYAASASEHDSPSAYIAHDDARDPAARVLQQEAARGELKRDKGFAPRGSRAYITAVKALLRRTDYSR
jgi:hypothetical protein